MQQELVAYQLTMNAETKIDTIGKFCRKVRRSKKVSLKHLGGIVKCNPSTISSFEQGKTAISSDTLVEILKLLQVELLHEQK